MISGRGREHGRLRILNAMAEPTTTLTWIKSTSSNPLSFPPRALRGGSTRTSSDVVDRLVLLQGFLARHVDRPMERAVRGADNRRFFDGAPGGEVCVDEWFVSNIS